MSEVESVRPSTAPALMGARTLRQTGTRYSSPSRLKMRRLAEKQRDINELATRRSSLMRMNVPALSFHDLGREADSSSRERSVTWRDILVNRVFPRRRRPHAHTGLAAFQSYSGTVASVTAGMSASAEGASGGAKRLDIGILAERKAPKDSPRKSGRLTARQKRWEKYSRTIARNPYKLRMEREAKRREKELMMQESLNLWQTEKEKPPSPLTRRKSALSTQGSPRHAAMITHNPSVTAVSGRSASPRGVPMSSSDRTVRDAMENHASICSKYSAKRLNKAVFRHWWKEHGWKEVAKHYNSDSAIDRIFSVITSNSYINSDEFVTMVTLSKLGLWEDRLRFAFKIFDLNDDGAISAHDIFRGFERGMHLQFPEDFARLCNAVADQVESNSSGQSSASVEWIGKLRKKSGKQSWSNLQKNTSGGKGGAFKIKTPRDVEEESMHVALTFREFVMCNVGREQLDVIRSFVKAFDGCFAETTGEHGGSHPFKDRIQASTGKRSALVSLRMDLPKGAKRSGEGIGKNYEGDDEAKFQHFWLKEARLDRLINSNQFVRIVCNFLGISEDNGRLEKICEYMFKSFDVDEAGLLGFDVVYQDLCTLRHENIFKRQRACFELFNISKEGAINANDLMMMEKYGVIDFMKRDYDMLLHPITDRIIQGAKKPGVSLKEFCELLNGRDPEIIRVFIPN
eukprot:111079_1